MWIAKEKPRIFSIFSFFSVFTLILNKGQHIFQIRLVKRRASVGWHPLHLMWKEVLFKESLIFLFPSHPTLLVYSNEGERKMAASRQTNLVKREREKSSVGCEKIWNNNSGEGGADVLFLQAAGSRRKRKLALVGSLLLLLLLLWGARLKVPSRKMALLPLQQHREGGGRKRRRRRNWRRERPFSKHELAQILVM